MAYAVTFNITSGPEFYAIDISNPLHTAHADGIPIGDTETHFSLSKKRCSSNGGIHIYTHNDFEMSGFQYFVNNIMLDGPKVACDAQKDANGIKGSNRKVVVVK